MPLANGTRVSSTSENLQILKEFDRWADVGRENSALDRFGKNTNENAKNRCGGVSGMTFATGW
jgi:hypothetical protein